MYVAGATTTTERILQGMVINVPFTMYPEQDPIRIVPETAKVSINGNIVSPSAYVCDVSENPLSFVVTNLSGKTLEAGVNVSVEAQYFVTINDYPPALTKEDWMTILRRGQAVLASLTSRIEALEGAPAPDPYPPTNDERPYIEESVVKVGDTATCNPGKWAGYPVPTFTYQWTLNGADIVGATASTYTAVAGDEGKYLACEVTATNTEGSETFGTNAVQVWRTPVNTAPPVISGVPEAWNNLTVSGDTWVGYPAISYSIKWYNDDVAIPGATTRTYPVQGADVGHTLTASVTATNAAGEATAYADGVDIT